ncbi:MAG: hypothetical protein AVDCRST_MAG24-1462 [uncultured Nocardioidaceae bacterium]|uniref:AMIN-like domain-containing protein n=1 Tax=uncultured Nocardioidaceae bacterium TaxID=253824 RepID=A0A6J4M0B1_9ACTN|nr:MAG: hypothetical protein AVDCRST_MAG24-1462 [uncultured Nocardioidaceae bacterium]
MRVPVKEDDMSVPRRRILRQLALAAALILGPAGTVAAGTLAAGPAAATAASDCRTAWGSLVERQAPRATGEVTGVRSGRHRCFDRLVIDVGAGEARPGFRVEYVDTVRKDGSGAEVALRGGARLSVVVVAPAYDEQGRATYQPADRRELVDVTGYDTFRQVAWAGTFEGRTTVGLGVRARLPMRAFTLTDAEGASRVVVDVAHSW